MTGLGDVVPFPGFYNSVEIPCLGSGVLLLGVGNGVQFLGFHYGVYFLGVQVCGFVSGGRVLGLTLCFPLVDVFEDSVQVCYVVGEDQVCGLPCSLGLSPWFATFSYNEELMDHQRLSIRLFLPSNIYCHSSIFFDIILLIHTYPDLL